MPRRRPVARPAPDRPIPDGRGAGPRQILSGVHVLEEALRARRRPLHRLWVASGDACPELRALAAQAGVPVVEQDPPLRRDPLPRLEAGPLPELALEELVLRDAAGPPVLVALDGVEDPQNLGSIARVADGAGAAGLLLTHRHAPPLSPAVSRASAGAIEWLPVARVTNLRRALEQLQREGFWVLGADLEGAESLFELPDARLDGPLVWVLGAEGRGLRAGIRQALDHRVRIPMLGHLASLNVAAAAAVLLFETARRRRPATPA